MYLFQIKQKGHIVAEKCKKKNTSTIIIRQNYTRKLRVHNVLSDIKQNKIFKKLSFWFWINFYLML